MGEGCGFPAQLSRMSGLSENQREVSPVVWFDVLITIDVILLDNQSVFGVCFLSLDSHLACCAL